MKKVSNKKERDAAEAEKERLKAKKELIEKEAVESADVLGDAENDDVIF